MVQRTFGTVGRLKATPQIEVSPSALNLSLVDPFAHVSNVRPEYLLPESRGDGILKGRVDTSVGGGQNVAHMSLRQVGSQHESTLYALLPSL